MEQHARRYDLDAEQAHGRRQGKGDAERDVAKRALERDDGDEASDVPEHLPCEDVAPRRGQRRWPERGVGDDRERHVQRHQGCDDHRDPDGEALDSMARARAPASGRSGSSSRMPFASTAAGARGRTGSRDRVAATYRRPATPAMRQMNARPASAGIGRKVSMPRIDPPVRYAAASAASVTKAATSAAGATDGRPPARSCASAAKMQTAQMRAPKIVASFETLNESVPDARRRPAK